MARVILFFIFVTGVASPLAFFTKSILIWRRNVHSWKGVLLRLSVSTILWFAATSFGLLVLYGHISAAAHLPREVSDWDRDMMVLPWLTLLLVIYLTVNYVCYRWISRKMKVKGTVPSVPTSK